MGCQKPARHVFEYRLPLLYEKALKTFRKDDVMQIVTDRAMDLAPEQLEGYTVSYAPLRLTLDGITYKSGEDIQPAGFP